MGNRQSPIINRQSDDELISAYLDGRLAEAERAAFEARLRAEPDVQRRLDVTRLLVATARALPAQPLPRDFTLPIAASAAPQTRAGARVNPLNWFLRLGSALAAAVFVIAIGLDLAGLSAPPAQPPAPAMQSQEAMAADVVMTVPAESGAAAPPGAAPAGASPEAQPASGEQPMQAMRQAAEPAVETQPTPEQPAQPMALPKAAADTAPAATLEAGSMQPAVVTETPATRVDALPASQPTEAPQSPDATMRPSESAPTAPPQSDTTPWLRIVAGVAFALAVSLGVLGWRRS